MFGINKAWHARSDRQAGLLFRGAPDLLRLIDRHLVIAHLHDMAEGLDSLG